MSDDDDNGDLEGFIVNTDDEDSDDVVIRKIKPSAVTRTKKRRVVDSDDEDEEEGEVTTGKGKPPRKKAQTLSKGSKAGGSKPSGLISCWHRQPHYIASTKTISTLICVCCTFPGATVSKVPALINAKRLPKDVAAQRRVAPEGASSTFTLST
jgi:hypothetical protein